MGRRETRRGAVVLHDAVVAQHHAVTAAADGERVPAVDVDAVQEFRDVLSHELDLAERGDVDDADVDANVARLAERGVVGRFAGARIRVRPLPQPCVDEARTVRDVPVVHRRVARRLDVRSGVDAGKGAQGDRSVGRPERRRAHGGDGEAELLREQRETDDVGRLALVGAHAERRVALEVLDRSIAFARGQRDVVDGHVVLPVDESLGALRRRRARSTAAAARRSRPVRRAGARAARSVALPARPAAASPAA